VPGLYSAPTVANVERMVLQKTLRRLTSVAALTSVGVLCSAAVLMSPAHAAETSDRPLIPAAAEHSWQWPVDGSRAVISSFHAPAHDYAAGHRGIDIAAAAAGSTDAVAVRAPTGGTIAFRGVVVDRPLVTIDHGGGLVTTLEPVFTHLRPGDVVAAGEQVGTAETGGHSARGTLHVGVRLNGDYINPMIFFGGVPRAVLLPCGESGC